MERKTSEWIALLQKFVDEKGDLPLEIEVGSMCYLPTGVEVIFDADSGEPSILMSCD